MSIRLDAAADRLLRTAGMLTPNAPYTWMGWIRLQALAKCYAMAFSAADILDAIGVSAAGAVELSVAAAGGGGGGGTTNYQVASSAGDSHMDSITNDIGRAPANTGIVSTSASPLSPGSHGNNAEWSAAIRLANITVAQGATISSATLELRGNASYNAAPNVVKFYVSAEASDNAPALVTTNGDLRSSVRPRTTATTVWLQTSVTGGTWHSVDVTAVVQEIVNRAGWASGNAIVFLIDTHEDTTQGEWQDYDSYDTASANAPKLSITTAGGGGGGSPTIVSGGSVAAATWLHLAMVRESNTVLKAYLNGALVATHTTDISGRSSVTRQEMGGQSASNNGPLDGRMAHAKMWDAALSVAEVINEMAVARPVRFANLWNWAPLWDSAFVFDQSGAAHDWSTAGSLSTEDGPAVAYGA